MTGLWRRLRRLVGRTPLEPLPFPPPYRGMLAISSDVEFTSWQAQLGLLDIFARRGLECGFSYWCFGDERMTWRLFDEQGRAAPYAQAAVGLIKAGLIDTLHSFGGVTDGRGAFFDRASMSRALECLAQWDVRTRVFSNHGTRLDIQNVGGDWADYQQGDVPESTAYHLDLTTAFGARFFWTDIDYDNQIPFFQLSGPPERALLVPQRGRDGTPILRFRRFRGAFARAPCASNLGEQLERVLAHEPDGYCVVYQHLGVHRLPDGKPVPAMPPYLNTAGLAALDRLAKLDAEGVLLVTSSERLLMHALVMQARPWRIEEADDEIHVHFASHFKYQDVPFQLSRADLDGWSLPIRPGQKVVVRLGGVEWELPIQRFGNQLVAGIPWERKPLTDIVRETIAVAES